MEVGVLRGPGDGPHELSLRVVKISGGGVRDRGLPGDLGRKRRHESQAGAQRGRYGEDPRGLPPPVDGARQRNRGR